MAFPTSPTDGQTAIVNSVTYQYANSTNAWTRILSTANIITANTIAVNGNISAAGNVSGTYVAGTLTTADQPNITNLGNLISLTVSNSSGTVNFQDTANVTLGGVSNLHISGGTANYVLSTNGSGSLSWTPQPEALTVVVDDFTGDGSTTVYTLSVTPGSIDDTTVNYNGAILLRTSYSLSVANIIFSSPPENGSEIEVTTIGGSFGGGGGGGTPGGSNTQVQFNDDTVFGGSAAFTFNKTSNILSVTGNVVSSNLLSSGLISAAGNVAGSYIFGNGSQLTGLPATYGNANVVANLAALGSNPISTTGNIDAGNLKTSGLVSATGNVSGNYILGNGALLTGVITSVANINNGTSNVTVVSSGGNITVGVGGTSNIAVFATTGEYVTGVVSASGNIISGNVLTDGLISAAGNITGASILTSGLASVTGNITGGNLVSNSIIGTELTIKSAGNLNLSSTGNVIFASNVQINNVGYPVQDADAATKLYVDNMVSTALSFHPAVTAATTTTLATATGGTITYTQPNGAANGVGAKLTTTGTFTVIDFANVATVGTRILVKNEANAVFNGVYTWANATNIVRSTDADEYGANSAEALSLNDYFFVSSGSLNGGSAYVVDAPVGTITFGTSNINFAQFSQAATYSNGTGLTLTGTTFSVNASQTQITAVGNLGSLIVTANTTSGNILTNGLISAAGNTTSGNILTGGLISATANVTANNGMFTNIVNVASHTGAVVSVTGNVTGGNLLTVGLVSATGNVSGNYFIGNGSVLSSLRPNLSMTVALSDETTTITTGTKITFRAPVAMNLYQIPRASLTTASSVGNPTIDINKNGVSIFSTTLTIDATETTSVTAVTPAVLSTTSIADNDIITMDVDVAGTSAAGLKVTLYYTQA